MKNNKDKKRGIFGRIIIFFLAILAFVGLLAMAMSVLSSYVDPVKFVWLSFFGLTFWVILFYNLAVFALLLLMWSRKVWISIIALLIAIPGIYKSFSTGSSQDGGELRVMSYNVLNFNDQYDKEKPRDSVAYDMIAMVKEYQPDVLCIQEFVPVIPKMNRKDCIARCGELMELPYTYCHEKANFGGNVIFSRYPLSALEEDIPFADENEYGAVARVDAGPKGVFYVLNCHLVSFQLSHEEVAVFSERGTSKEQVEEYGKSIVSKLMTAYRKRSEEVSKMLEDIPNDGRAILLCGDFNDTPLSYTYHQIYRAGFAADCRDFFDLQLVEIVLIVHCARQGYDDIILVFHCDADAVRSAVRRCRCSASFLSPLLFVISL